MTAMAMLIEVIATDGATTPQARAYAEYRVFAALARHTRVIRHVRVELAHAEGNGRAGCVRCAVHLTLQPSGSARARAQGPHAFGAIDRAADRIGEVMARRSPESMSS
jgi:ribosome-associated translation inhibitor RaiA